MRLINTSELAGKSQSQLSALYAMIKEQMEGLDPNSYEYEILAHSLYNIRRAFTAPRLKPPGL